MRVYKKYVFFYGILSRYNMFTAALFRHLKAMMKLCRLSTLFAEENYENPADCSGHAFLLFTSITIIYTIRIEILIRRYP